MQLSLVVILFFYSLAVSADNDKSCLKVNQEKNKLTFSYLKQAKEDIPFFYAKVLINNQQVANDVVWQDVQQMKTLLLPISNTSPKEYQLPEGSKSLFIIKSLTYLKRDNGFGIPSRIMPSVFSSDNPVTKIATKRNVGNYIRTLPKETKIQDYTGVVSSMNICEYRL